MKKVNIKELKTLLRSGDWVSVHGNTLHKVKSSNSSGFIVGNYQGTYFYPWGGYYEEFYWVPYELIEAAKEL